MKTIHREWLTSHTAAIVLMSQAEEKWIFGQTEREARKERINTNVRSTEAWRNGGKNVSNRQERVKGSTEK